MIGEDFYAVNAVGISYGVFVLVFIRNAVVVPVFFPDGGIGSVVCYGFGNFRIPASEDIALSGRGSDEFRRSVAGKEIGVNLIGKDFFTVNAVGVSNGVFVFVFVRNTVVVPVFFPDGGIGCIACYGLCNFRIPASEDIALSGRGSDEFRRSVAGKEIGVNLIGEDFFAVNAVGVGNGVCISEYCYGKGGRFLIPGCL